MSSCNFYCLYILFFISILNLTHLDGQIINIESQRIITDTTGWSGNIVASVSASKNTKSFFTFNGQGHLQFKSTKDVVLGILDYSIVHAGGENFNNNGFGHLRYNRKVSSLLRLEAFNQIQFNKIAKIEVRYLNGIGIRMKLSQLESAKFYYGLTYMYEYEEVDDFIKINRDHRLSSYFTFSLLPESNILFRNTTYIQPRLDKFTDYRLSNDTRLVFNITRQLKFVTNFHYVFDANPPTGVPKSTYEVRNGLSYGF